LCRSYTYHDRVYDPGLGVSINGGIGPIVTHRKAET